MKARSDVPTSSNSRKGRSRIRGDVAEHRPYPARGSGALTRFVGQELRPDELPRLYANRSGRHPRHVL